MNKLPRTVTGDPSSNKEEWNLRLTEETEEKCSPLPSI